GLLFGMACSATLALLIGPVVLRVMGKYFVLVTFLLVEIVRLVFVEWVSVTGGSNGIFGIPPIHPLLSAPVAIYYFILVVSLAVIGLCARIFASETGRAIESSRQALHVAEASGIPVMRLHVGVFVLSAALVGLQGGLLAFFLEYIDPDTFGMTASLNFVVMNVIGGMYNMIGPIIGAVFLVALPEMLRSYVELQQIIFGVVLIIVMAFFSGGIVNVYAIVK